MISNGSSSNDVGNRRDSEDQRPGAIAEGAELEAYFQLPDIETSPKTGGGLSHLFETMTGPVLASTDITIRTVSKHGVF
jgi:hypothetical protein